jgi:hypothetical protein
MLMQARCHRMAALESWKVKTSATSIVSNGRSSSGGSGGASSSVGAAALQWFSTKALYRRPSLLQGTGQPALMRPTSLHERTGAH